MLLQLYITLNKEYSKYSTYDLFSIFMASILVAKDKGIVDIIESLL